MNPCRTQLKVVFLETTNLGEVTVRTYTPNLNSFQSQGANSQYSPYSQYGVQVNGQIGKSQCFQDQVTKLRSILGHKQ